MTLPQLWLVTSTGKRVSLRLLLQQPRCIQLRRIVAGYQRRQARTDSRPRN